jgi:hypothetical protein
VDANGTIVGSGSFHTVALAPIIGVAVWKALAQITANHFLAEIDEKLESIETKLDALHQVLHDSWKGQLHGHARKLAAISKELLANDLREHELQAHLSSIEHIDTNSRAIAAAAELRRPRIIAQLEQIEPEVTLRGEKLAKKTEALQARLDELDDCALQEYFALYVRVLGLQVRSSLATSGTVTTMRIAEIEDELRSASERNAKAVEVARERIAALKGRLTMAKTDDDVRRKLLQSRRDVVVRSQDLGDAVRHVLADLKARLLSTDSADSIWLTIDERGDVDSAHVARPGASG